MLTIVFLYFVLGGPLGFLGVSSGVHKFFHFTRGLSI